MRSALAIALGLAAIAQGQHVHFLSAGELTHLLPEQMPARLAALCKPKLLIIDEMGLQQDLRRVGATSSATRSWRRRSWTASCTTR